VRKEVHVEHEALHACRRKVRQLVELGLLHLGDVLDWEGAHHLPQFLALLAEQEKVLRLVAVRVVADVHHVFHNVQEVLPKGQVQVLEFALTQPIRELLREFLPELDGAQHEALRMRRRLLLASVELAILPDHPWYER